MPFQFVWPRWPLALALLASAVAAQTPKPSQAPEIAPILTQPLQYRSWLSHYEPYSDPAVQPWREANDRVQRIGGWRAYARERSEQAPVSGALGLEGHPAAHGGAKP